MDILSNMNLSDLIPYCIFPNSFIRNGNLTSQQRILFQILCSYDHIGSDGTRKGWCSVSIDTLSKQMGLKRRAVQTHLKRLVELGMVIVVYRNMSISDGKTSLYILNILPGISEDDRKRIALARNIEIKHQISGLNTIRVLTADGITVVPEEKFDLEYIITGQQSSTILEADAVADKEDIISSKEESEIPDKELFGYRSKFRPVDLGDDEELHFTTGRKVVMEEKKPGWNSEDPVIRINAGNYEKIGSTDMCMYFKHLVETQYPGLPYLVDTKTNRDTNTMHTFMNSMDIDRAVLVLQHFVKHYDKLFMTPQYPKPAIWNLSQTWIMNKLIADFDKNIKTEDIKEKLEEKPVIEGKKQQMF